MPGRARSGRYRVARPALWLVALLLLAGCATSRSRHTGPVQRARIAVFNDLIPPGEVTIWIMPQDDPGRVLGGLGPGRSRIFDYTVASEGAPYQLQAVTADGTKILSRRFPLLNQDDVVWHIRNNRLEVRR